MHDAEENIVRSLDEYSFKIMLASPAAVRSHADLELALLVKCQFNTLERQDGLSHKLEVRYHGESS